MQFEDNNSAAGWNAFALSENDNITQVYFCTLILNKTVKDAK